MTNSEIQPGTDVASTSPQTATGVERLPWVLRALLGAATAAISVGLTYLLEPLRGFPLLIAFPTVVLSAWFLGMPGAFGCAVVEILLVDYFLTAPRLRFSIGDAPEELRMTVFLVVSTLLGWSIRRLSDQREELHRRDLEQRLMLADAERRLAEERAAASEALHQRDDELQLALRVHGMGLWVWDVPHNTIDWSDEVYRLLGHQPGAISPSADAWFVSIHPEDIAQVRQKTAQDLESGTEFYNLFRVIWADSSIHWIESQSACRRDSQGRALRLLGVLSDVTHRKQAEQAMLRAEKLAVAGRLAASVAHEINNPLESVANLLYLITLTAHMDEVRVHAQRALDELLRVSLITQSTLKFHRQTGSPRLTRLSEIVEAVLALFRGRLLSSGITAEVRMKHEITIACMPSEAQQIFANLVSNALEATPRGGRIVIRLRPSRDWRDSRTEGMRVTFADSGTGMDRATLHRIFEPFFTTKAETGTGLGMWVVAQLVERHHGHVRVWSTQRPNESGTAFSVFLPIGAVPETVAGNRIGLEPARRSTETDQQLTTT